MYLSTICRNKSCLLSSSSGQETRNLAIGLQWKKNYRRIRTKNWWSIDWKLFEDFLSDFGWIRVIWTVYLTTGYAIGDHTRSNQPTAEEGNDVKPKYRLTTSSQAYSEMAGLPLWCVLSNLYEYHFLTYFGARLLYLFHSTISLVLISSPQYLPDI